MLECLVAGMGEAEIIAQHASLTVAGIRAPSAYGAEFAREEIIPALLVKIELDENLPAPVRELLGDRDAGHLLRRRRRGPE